MSYIVTTKRPGEPEITRTVATLERAHDEAELASGLARKYVEDRIAESGGTVGPLPDGTLIEVETAVATKRYRTIVADPPWEIDGGRSRRTDARNGGWVRNRPGALPYPTLGVADIRSLPVAGVSEPNASLFLWTVNAHIEDAYDIVRAWGFKPSTLLTWCKPGEAVLGGTFGPTAEFVLFARRGSPQRTGRVGRTWWEWPRGAHSAKPDAFLDLVEQVSPGPYLEMFARRARFGWDYWGDESLGTAGLAA
jgi:N6-adenosine-specific RNA methylase IME4